MKGGVIVVTKRDRPWWWVFLRLLFPTAAAKIEMLEMLVEVNREHYNRLLKDRDEWVERFLNRRGE